MERRMPDQTRTSQVDPPEGSREVIDREVERMNQKKQAEPRAAGRPPHEANEGGSNSAR